MEKRIKEGTEAYFKREIQEVRPEQQKFYEDVRKASKIERPTVAVCGNTGVGKSSLISTLLDVNVGIAHGKPCTQNFDLYEDEFVRIYDSKGLETGENIETYVQNVWRFIQDKYSASDPDDCVHVVWYAISATGARITDADKEIIAKIFDPNRLLVVLTKCDVARNSQIEALTEILTKSCNIDNRRIFTVCDSEGMKDEGTPEFVKKGAKKLLDATISLLPEGRRHAVEVIQKVDIKRKIQYIESLDSKASSIIGIATVEAAAQAGLNIIPLSDGIILTVVQGSMVGELAALYGIRISKEYLWPIIAKLAGTQAAKSLVKLIPIVGSVINAAVAVTFTGGMGLYLKSSFKNAAIAMAQGKPQPTFDFNFDMLGKFIEMYKQSSK